MRNGRSYSRCRIESDICHNLQTVPCGAYSWDEVRWRCPGIGPGVDNTVCDAEAVDAIA